MPSAEQRAGDVEPAQYRVSTVLLVWAAAALPMGVLGWVVAPALAGSEHAAIVRLATLTVGLVWQAALVLILLRREAGTLSWKTIARRLWLGAPRSPTTGQPQARLWWWLVPALVAVAVFDLVLAGPIGRAWVALLPMLAEPPGFSMTGLLATPEARAQLHGEWSFLAVFFVQAIFNTVIGEEMLFRGLLLPRMARAFGKWDWVANGLLFGLYHLHQPWGMVNSALKGVLCLALPSRRFRCAWFGIAAHSGQSAYLLILITALVL